MTSEQVQQLEYALDQFAGRTLTPELTEAIVRAATFQADHSIDPARFAPLTVGDYTMRAERFTDILDELHPMHVRHWQETEKHRHGIALAPDYARVQKAERSGAMVQFTLRKAGELVGQLRMYLGMSIHSSTLFAEEDTLFIEQEHRGVGFLPLHLMRYGERCLLDVGVREIRATSKLLNHADVLMRRLGYKAVALEFVKMFEAATPTEGSKA